MINKLKKKYKEKIQATLGRLFMSAYLTGEQDYITELKSLVEVLDCFDDALQTAYELGKAGKENLIHKKILKGLQNYDNSLVNN